MGSIFWTNLGDTTCKWSLTNKTTAAVDDIDADADRKLPKDDKRRQKTSKDANLKFLANIDLYCLRCSED